MKQEDNINFPFIKKEYKGETQMKQETIHFKGNKKTWFDFTNEVRKKGKTIWEVLGPMLEGYLLKEETLEGRDEDENNKRL